MPTIKNNIQIRKEDCVMKKILFFILKLICIIWGIIFYFAGIGELIMCFTDNINPLIFNVIMTIIFLGFGTFLFYIALKKLNYRKSSPSSEFDKSGTYVNNKHFPEHTQPDTQTCGQDISLQDSAVIDNSFVINNTSDEQIDGYIKTDNTIHRTDGKPITDEQIPYLIQVSHEKATAKMKIPQLVQLINESYLIMCNTDNPETLCNRYKFACTKMQELKYYYNQGFCNEKDIDCCKLLYTTNFCKLISSCYQKYATKARTELKTQKGVQNRINKFWTVIQNNVDTNVYLELRRYCK